MTKLEALAKDCIENHTHRLVDKPTKQDIYLREESIFIQGYRQSEKRITELEITNKRISDECHKLVDSLEKKQNENVELKDEVHTWKEASENNSYKAFQLQEENKELIGKIAFTENALNNAKAQIEKMKCWCNCKNYISCLEECCRKNISFVQGICYNCKKWEIREK